MNHVHHEFEVSILPGSPVATAGAEPNPAGVDMDVTERTKLKFQLEQNVKYLKGQLKKSWFIKKWMYKSMLTQYSDILENYFRN